MKELTLNDSDIFKNLKAQGFHYDIGTETFYAYREGKTSHIPISQTLVASHVQRLVPAFSPSKVNDVVNKYKAICGVTFLRRGFKSFQNGAIDFEKRKFLSSGPELFVECDSDYKFIKNEKKFPVIKKFLKTSLGRDKDSINTLLDILAMSLDLSWTPPVILILLGSGGDGKSTFLSFVRSLNGEKRTACLNTEELPDKFKSIQLENATINVADENFRNFDLKVTRVLKNITAGSHFTLEEKFKQPRVAFLKVVAIFALNQPPVFKEWGDAMERRVVLIRFHQIPKNDQDPYMLEKMLEERPAFLNHLLRRHLKLKKIGRLDIPESIRKQTRVSLQPNSNIKLFVLSNYEVTGQRTDKVLKQDIYDVYLEYCKKFSLKPFVYQTFCKDLKKAFPDLKVSKTKNKERDVYCYVGIKPNKQLEE